MLAANAAQLRKGLFGVGEHGIELDFSIGCRVEYRDIDAVFEQARGPTAADYAATDDGGHFDFSHINLRLTGDRCAFL